MTTPVPPDPGALPPTPFVEVARAADYARASRAPRTVREYAADWRAFAAWCAERGHVALPAAPAVVGVHLAWLADRGLKAATIQRRLVTIGVTHADHGHHLDTRHPAIRRTHQGIRRAIGTAQAGKAPLLPADLRAMSAALPASPAGLRDRALLLVGFAAALRRSELAALRREDVEIAPDRMVLAIRRSKTDPEAAGERIGILAGTDPATCPVRALAAWTAAAGIGAGPLFRPVDRRGRIAERAVCGRTVANVVKAAAAAAGLDPARYAGHSLRAGLATAAALAGVEERLIMRQTRHASTKMLRRYIRDHDLWRGNPTGRVGL